MPQFPLRRVLHLMLWLGLGATPPAFGDILVISGSNDGHQAEYDRGYLVGYDEAYARWFASGEVDGRAAGEKQGFRAGYDLGFEASYTPAFETSYDLYLPLGTEAGMQVGFAAGVSLASSNSGVSYGTLTMAGRPPGGGGLSGTLTLSSGASRLLSDFDRGYQSGNQAGKVAGSAAGYEVGFAESYPIHLDLGRTAGVVEGSRRGAEDGASAGFDAGYIVGYQQGFELADAGSSGLVRFGPAPTVPFSGTTSSSTPEPCSAALAMLGILALGRRSRHGL